MKTRKERALSIITLVLELALLASVLAVGYSVAATFSSNLASLGREQPPFSIEMGSDPVTGARTYTVRMPVRNTGLLPMKIQVDVQVTLPSGEVIAEGRSSQYILPGQTVDLALTVMFRRSLTLDSRVAGRIEYKTLFDLVSAEAAIEAPVTEVLGGLG